MATLNGKDVLKNLKKKGFTNAQHKSIDHKYLEFFYKGKLVTHTKISHGGKSDLGPDLISQMAHQCKLDKKKFIEFATCRLSEVEYISIMIENKIIDIEK